MSKETIIECIQKQDWNKLYPLLKAHAVRRLSWAGLNPKEGLKGMDPSNIVSEAIESIIQGRRNPRKQDLDDLGNYLCNVINSIISNLKTSEEWKTTKMRTSDTMTDDEFFEFVYDDDLLEIIEKKDIISIIENELLEHDEDMYLVFAELIKGKTHSDIANSLNFTVSNVENIHKRINTFVKKYLPKVAKLQA